MLSEYQKHLINKGLELLKEKEEKEAILESVLNYDIAEIEKIKKIIQ